MTRGFTLIELLITVVVLSLLIAWAVPSYTSISETTKMQRLAKELNGFVVNAKSEAVLRRQNLWAHLVMSGSSNTTGDWKFALTDSSTAGGGVEILALSGEPFNNITITNASYSSSQISFDATHGSPKSGSLIFHPQNISNNALKLITHNRSGIVRICSPNSAELYGYEAC